MWVLPTERSNKADALWEKWRAEKVEITGPPLLYAEVTSVIRENVYHQRLLEEEGEDAFAAFCQMGIRSISHPELHLKAWELAKEYNQPRAYDSQYLALAKLMGCELWTADKSLVNSLQGKLSWVKWIGDYVLR